MNSGMVSMKVKIPRTLAEPLTIPWMLLEVDDGKLIITIREKLQQYMDYLKRRDWHSSFSDGSEAPFGRAWNSISEDTLLRSLRILARNAGGIDVETTSSSLNQDTHWVYFKVREDGPRYTEIIIPKR
jgi:hypothetical protein